MTNKAPVMDGEVHSPHIAGAVRLLLGGRDTRIKGFLNVDLYEGENVDIKANAANLSMFKDHSVEELYASHILEHFSHLKTVPVLREWRRILKPGAKAHIAVPDFDAAIKHYLKYGLNDWSVNMLYGDQIYDLAYHYTPFTFARLAKALIDAGFSDVVRVKHLPYGLGDCSTLVATRTLEPVSLNVEATA